jgi:cell division protein FtsL
MQKLRGKMLTRLDRFTKVLLTLLVVGVYSLLLASIFQGQPVAAKVTPNVVKWEYKIEEVRPDGSPIKINVLGKEGWEMLAATADAKNQYLLLYFKRRIS